MSTEKVDYAAILADVEAKITALEKYKNSLREAMAAGALGQSGEIPSGSFSASGGPIDLPVGAFLGKSVPAAVKLYLSSIRKKQTTSQIAVALKEGGMETTASNFDQVIAGALFRLKAAGEVLRFPDGWGFAEHYPEHIRKAVTQEKKPASKKAKKANKVKLKAKKEPIAKAQVVPIAGGLEKRILEVLQRTPSALGSTEIAKMLNVNPTGALLTLGRMAAKGVAEKAGNGYRAIKSA